MATMDEEKRRRSVYEGVSFHTRNQGAAPDPYSRNVWNRPLPSKGSSGGVGSRPQPDASRNPPTVLSSAERNDRGGALTNLGRGFGVADAASAASARARADALSGGSAAIRRKISDARGDFSSGYSQVAGPPAVVPMSESTADQRPTPRPGRAQMMQGRNTGLGTPASERPMIQPLPPAPEVPSRTPTSTVMPNYGLSVMGGGEVARPQTQSQPMARPMPDPALHAGTTPRQQSPYLMRRAALDPRSASAEMVRRAEMASSRLMDMARSTPGTYTAAQLRAAEAAVRGPQQFWQDQAASIGAEAQQRFIEAQRLRSREQESLARQRSRQNLAQFQQQGAMDQLNRSLSQPQQIMRADGTIGFAAPGQAFTPLMDESGELVRGMTQPGRDYAGEANARARGQALASIYGNQALTDEERASAIAGVNEQFGGGATTTTQMSEGDWVAEMQRRGSKLSPEQLREYYRENHAS